MTEALESHCIPLHKRAATLLEAWDSGATIGDIWPETLQILSRLAASRITGISESGQPFIGVDE